MVLDAAICTYIDGSRNPYAPPVKSFYGDGEVKTAITNKDHIGTFVARIITDPRTLNRYVSIREVEVTLN